MCGEDQPRFWGFTFCAMARRALIVFFVVLAVIEAAWAVHLPLSQQVLTHRHLLFATVLATAATLLFVFDWWWESRNQDEEVLILEEVE